MITVFVGDGNTEVNILGSYFKITLGNKRIERRVYRVALTSARYYVDTARLGTLNVKLAVLIPKLLDISAAVTRDCVEVTCKQSVRYRLIVKLIRFYHSIAAE